MWDSLYSPAMERWRWGVRSLSMAARLHFVAAVSVCMEKKTDLCSPPNTGWPCHVWPGRLRKHSPEASGDTDCPVYTAYCTCTLYMTTSSPSKLVSCCTVTEGLGLKVGRERSGGFVCTVGTVSEMTNHLSIKINICLVKVIPKFISVYSC